MTDKNAIHTNNENETNQILAQTSSIDAFLKPRKPVFESFEDLKFLRDAMLGESQDE